MSIGADLPLLRAKSAHAHAVVRRTRQSGIAIKVRLRECPRRSRGAFFPGPKDSSMQLLPFPAGPALSRATLLVSSLLITAAVALSVPLRAQDDPVVAKVNGTDVRQSDLAM